MELPGLASAPTDEASRAAALTEDPRKWWALAVLLLAQLMLILDIAIVNVAIPSVQKDLDVAPGDVQWIVTAYLLPFGGMLLLGGRVADYTGRKRLFCVAAVGFAIASAVGGAAQSEGVLFAARALQGFFGAGMAPALLSMLTLGFPGGRDRTLAFALYGGVGAAGGALGLVIGGALTEYLSWRWCFLINVPISVLLVIAAFPLLRESKAEGRPHYDVMGGILGTLGLLGLIFGIARAADKGWGSQEVLAPLVAGVLTLIGFFLWELRARDPLMPVSILANRARASGFAAIICVYGPPSAMILLLLIYFQGPQGLSPVEAGASFATIPASAIFAAALTIKLVGKVSPRLLLGTGSLMGTAALFWFTRLELDSTYVEDMLPGMVVMGFGTAMAYVAATNIALFGIPDRDTGVASAVMNAVQQVGAALGVAILSTIAASASADYVAANGPRSFDEAIVHGNEEAFLIGTFMMLGLTIAAVLLLPPRLRIGEQSARRDGPEAIEAAVTAPLAPGTDT